MCNSYEQRVGWAAYKAAMNAIEMVRIGDVAPVMRAADGAVELAPMRFGLPANNPMNGPVFNFRSESRSFANSNRFPGSGLGVL